MIEIWVGMKFESMRGNKVQRRKFICSYFTNLQKQKVTNEVEYLFLFNVINLFQILRFYLIKASVTIFCTPACPNEEFSQSTAMNVIRNKYSIFPDKIVYLPYYSSSQLVNGARLYCVPNRRGPP